MMHCKEPNPLVIQGPGGGTKDISLQCTKQIRDETEYIKKMRVTLQTLRMRMFGKNDGVNSQQGQDTKGLSQEGAEESDPEQSVAKLGVQHQQLLADVEARDTRLHAVRAENQELSLKLEATQQAGASAIKDVTRRFRSRMEVLEEQQAQERSNLQAFAEEQEQTLEQKMETLNRTMSQLQERQHRMGELERLIERMEKEKHELTERKQSVEEEMENRKTNVVGNRYKPTRAQDLLLETAILQEKISHLDNMVSYQQRNLFTEINTIEQLKMELAKQDRIIWSLNDRISDLEARNKVLKQQVHEVKSSQRQEDSSDDCSVGQDIVCAPPVPQQFSYTRPAHLRPRTALSSQRASAVTCPKPAVGTCQAIEPDSISTEI
uniref:Coiled-coil domain-containing protein 68 n=1 Tax=Callorhinchus milii TaxID=7868 RepID=A0A4W3HWE8_CALMI|eukprot:gi/632969755/ref/XP_007901262.1/ PREDICTED: coiled-coil domain-containing protein 68 [Callorhinchus milii]